MATRFTTEEALLHIVGDSDVENDLFEDEPGDDEFFFDRSDNEFGLVEEVVHDDFDDGDVEVTSRMMDEYESSDEENGDEENEDEAQPATGKKPKITLVY